MITLPDGIADALERWAISEGNKSSTLAGFIVETQVRNALANGIIPEPGNAQSKDAKK
ncbi:hypothetical protein N836_00305 [Leptolyngbya sp. Heron Island J]|nr:hypothetical protein N836_00305 [Leptolyngbya sp. Heron Island J]